MLRELQELLDGVEHLLSLHRLDEVRARAQLESPLAIFLGSTLLYWMTTRYEEQGQAVVDDIRERDRQWKAQPRAKTP